MSVINNQAYAINTVSGEVSVDIGQNIPYEYIPGKTINLMGYNASNYNEMISKSLVSLADEIKDLSDNGLAASDLMATATRDSAIADIQNAVVDITNDVKRLANEQVVNALDIISIQIDNNTNKNNDQDKDINNINNILGNDSNGMIYDVNQIKMTLGDSSSAAGLFGKSIEHDTSIGVLQTLVGENDTAADIVLSKGVIPTVQDQAFDIFNLKKYVADLETTVGGTEDGLVSSTKILQMQMTGNPNETTDIGVYYTVMGENGLNKKFNDFAASLNVDDISATLEGIKTNAEKIEIIETTIGDDTKGVIKKLNTSSIAALAAKEDIGTVSTTDSIKYNINNILNTLGTSVNDAGILRDVNILNSYDLSTMSTKVIGVTSDKKDGIIYKMDHIVDETILPTVASFLTFTETVDDEEVKTVYNAGTLHQLFNTLDTSSLNELKSKFKEYFYDGLNETYYNKDDVLGQSIIDNWVADSDSSNGYNKTTEEYLKVSNYINEIITNIETINASETTENSIKYNVLKLKQELFGDDTNKGKLGDIEDSISDNNSSIETLETTLSNQITSDIASNNTIKVDPIKNDVDIIKTQINNVSNIKEELEELSIESAKYLTFMPWLKSIMVDVLNDAVTESDLTSKFDNVINNISDVIGENSIITSDTIVEINDTGKLVISINLDKGKTFNSDNDLITIDIVIDDVKYNLELHIPSANLDKDYVLFTDVENTFKDVDDNDVSITADNIGGKELHITYDIKTIMNTIEQVVQRNK